MALSSWLLVIVHGRRSKRPGPSPKLGSLGSSHQWYHKSLVSLRGPLAPIVLRALLMERCATLVDCCITRSPLDSYWLNLFITYCFLIHFLNIFPKLFKMFYLSEIWIRYTFLKTRFIIWDFLVHCCITGSLLYLSWLNMLISCFFLVEPC